MTIILNKSKLSPVHFPKIHRSVLRNIAIDYCIFETFMTSICEKKMSAEVRLIHAKQISLYKFYRFKKKQQTQLKTKQVKQDILNEWESMGIPKLSTKC